MTHLDQSLATAIASLEIALIADPDLDAYFRLDKAAGLFVVAVYRDDDGDVTPVAECSAARLADALILAEQAVHNATRKAVAA